MKTIITLAALTLTTLSSFAQEWTADPALSAVSTLTRAEVRTELTAAIADGERLPAGEFSLESLPSNQSALTRAQARARLSKAIANGQFPASGEASVTPMNTHTMAMADQAKLAVH